MNVKMKIVDSAPLPMEVSKAALLKMAAHAGGSAPFLPIASETILGGIKVGDSLKIDENGALSVDTAAAVEQDNTRPVTSAAVHMELGNIEVLLAAL